jgi:hypothetical protein
MGKFNRQWFWEYAVKRTADRVSKVKYRKHKK